MGKVRLDVFLAENGYAKTRSAALGMIMAGEVFVDGEKADKAGMQIKEDAVITVKGKSQKYVSRGGLKLEKAMKAFPVTLEGKVAMDIGASTGGFTDCMLQNGARKERLSIDGILDTDLLEIVRHRLQCFQQGEFATRENACALTHIEEALMWMNKRVEDRIERGVLGTNNK